MKASALLLPLFFAVMFLHQGCDQQSPADAAIQPTHCQNGIRDGNEERTDCGGDCLSCAPRLGCVEEENYGVFSEDLEGSVTSVSCDAEHDEIIVSGTFGTIVLLFHENDFPESSRKYTLDKCGFPEDQYVCAGIRLKAYPGLTFYAQGGTLGVFREGNDYSFTFCNVFFANSNSAVSVHGSAKFSCD